mgnify:CR=1 FL=1
MATGLVVTNRVGRYLAPLPAGFFAVGSSGQRGRGAKSRVSVWPSCRRSTPAQAIIAALSVHSFSGGAWNRKPSFSVSAVSRARAWAS